MREGGAVTAPRPILSVEGVSKSFCRDTARSLRYGVFDIVRDLLPGVRRQGDLRPGEFWSLDDVSFKLYPGEALAIGGRNGAGKTTLLRILAGLLRPDRGSLKSHGVINSVIELGQGLNPQLSGRENTELGLAWRGTGPTEIARLAPAVERFAGLGSMFDTPVHSYSAGMRVRLAFAIAATVPCDLLLLDEVLAVGDLAFQRKCIERLRQHLQDRGALILVSHNPIQMQALCRRGILLDRGRLVVDSPIEECIDRMFALQEAETAEVSAEFADQLTAGVQSVEVHGIRDGKWPTSGGELVFDVQFSLSQPARVQCSATIWMRDLSTCITSANEENAAILEAGIHKRRCTVPNLPLAQGVYAMRVTLVDTDAMLPIAHQGYDSPAIELRVVEPLSRQSLLSRHIGQLFWLDSEWSQLLPEDGKPS